MIEDGFTPCLRATEENEPFLAISINSDKFSVYLYKSICTPFITFVSDVYAVEDK
jgi:hypothetical protein